MTLEFQLKEQTLTSHKNKLFISASNVNIITLLNNTHITIHSSDLAQRKLQ